MDNSKYIEALDELISYHRKALDKLEEMKLAAVGENPEKKEDEYETVVYPGKITPIGGFVDDYYYYDPILNQTHLRKKRGL